MSDAFVAKHSGLYESQGEGDCAAHNGAYGCFFRMSDTMDVSSNPYGTKIGFSQISAQNRESPTIAVYFSLKKTEL